MFGWFALWQWVSEEQRQLPLALVAPVLRFYRHIRLIGIWRAKIQRGGRSALCCCWLGDGYVICCVLPNIAPTDPVVWRRRHPGHSSPTYRIPPRPWSGRAPGVCLDPSAGGSVTYSMDVMEGRGSALMKAPSLQLRDGRLLGLDVGQQIRPWVLAPTVAQWRADAPAARAARRSSPRRGGLLARLLAFQTTRISAFYAVLLSPFILHTALSRTRTRYTKVLTNTRTLHTLDVWTSRVQSLVTRRARVFVYEYPNTQTAQTPEHRAQITEHQFDGSTAQPVALQSYQIAVCAAVMPSITCIYYIGFLSGCPLGRYGCPLPTARVYNTARGPGPSPANPSAPSDSDPTLQCPDALGLSPGPGNYHCPANPFHLGGVGALSRYLVM